MNEPLQPSETPEVDRPRAEDAPLEPFKLGDLLPRAMGVGDMCRAFPVNGKVRDRSSFHRLERAGKFRKFELPAISGRKAWSGAKVSRYLDGEPVAALRPVSHKVSA